MRILIVDDEPDARELISEVLTERGAVVELAGSATEGFESLLRFHPEILVSASELELSSSALEGRRRSRSASSKPAAPALAGAPPSAVSAMVPRASIRIVPADEIGARS